MVPFPLPNPANIHRGSPWKCKFELHVLVTTSGTVVVLAASCNVPGKGLWVTDEPFFLYSVCCSELVWGTDSWLDSTRCPLHLQATGTWMSAKAFVYLGLSSQCLCEVERATFLPFLFFLIFFQISKAQGCTTVTIVVNPDLSKPISLPSSLPPFRPFHYEIFQTYKIEHHVRNIQLPTVQLKKFNINPLKLSEDALLPHQPGPPKGLFRNP